MWRRSKNKVAESKQAHNKVKASQRIDTLVGVKTKVHGDINFTGGLHIDGEVVGNIASALDEPSLLIVGKSAKIKGDIRVNRAVVNGQIIGKIFVYDHIELGEHALIQGDVHYNLLEMAVGSEVRGILIPDIKKEPRNLLEDHTNRDKKAQTEVREEELV